MSESERVPDELTHLQYTERPNKEMTVQTLGLGVQSCLTRSGGLVGTVQMGVTGRQL